MKVVEFTIDENAEDYGVFAISLVEQPAIEENFKYFSKEGRPKNFATVDKDKGCSNDSRHSNITSRRRGQSVQMLFQ
jgi:hypothetical protein